MSTRLAWAAVLSLLFALDVSAQITVPEVSEAYDPIVAKCEYAVDEKSIVAGTWFAGEGVKIEHRPQTKKVRIGKREFTVVDDSKPPDLRIWAKPGEHTLRIMLSINRVEYRQVFVADESDPTNKEKAQAETVPILVSSENKEFTQKFRVLDPRPPPKPIDPVDPIVDPPKPPVPTILKPLHVVVVHEPQPVAPDTGIVLRSNVWDKIVARGHTHRFYATGPPDEIRSADHRQAVVNAKGRYPSLQLYDKATGGFVTEQLLPLKSADVESLVKKYEVR